MDIGSNPLGISKGGTSGSSDSSLNGLKFGKKIYFEDVGIGVSTKSGSGSSSILIPEGIPLVSQTPGPARKGRGVVQGGQPPRCQVEGCDVDLSGAKSYYSRHKVCSMHSKSPKVIVAGLEQRFCQQCSRFHQLPEFDQGKRSCRRRLAGHNERRRKPQPGSLLSPRIGRLSSLQDSGRVSGFVMDFSAYPRTSEREVWPTIRAQGDQPTATGKFLAQQWQGIPVSHQANVYSHGSHPYMRGSSAGENILSSSRTPPPSECFAGVNDSGCALSLLSNQSQSWGLKNQSSSSLPMNNLMNNEGTPMAQSTTSHAVVMNNNFTGHSWSFKSDEAGTSSNGLHHDLGLVQVSSHAINVCEFSDGLEFGHQQTNRQYTDLAHSRAYDSSSTTHEMNWSL